MLGDNESEIELADRAVALNANLYFGWQNRGCGLQIAGLHEEALRSFECAMRLPLGLPDFPFAKCPDREILRLGERESGTGTLRQAVEAYREALKERTRERVRRRRCRSILPHTEAGGVRLLDMDFRVRAFGAAAAKAGVMGIGARRVAGGERG